MSTSTEYESDMFSNVEFVCDFWILKKLLNLPHGKSGEYIYYLGGPGIGISIY